MEVKIKKLSDKAVVPSYSNLHDAAMDLTATSIKENHSRLVENHEFTEYGTDLAIEIPAGFVGLIFPRSSISKTSMTLANSVGVIDAGYRGEIKVRMRTGGELVKYKVGDRIAQIMIIPRPSITLVEVDELEDTERGTGSFGSSGI